MTMQSTVTLAGVLSLSGMKSEFFDSRDYSSILETLAYSVDGWNLNSMQVTATSLHARTLATSYSHDVEFTVTFLAEDFGVDGALYAAAEGLVQDMGATLQSSIISGDFVQRLSTSTLASSSMKDIIAVEVLSLEIVSISYADNRLVYYYDSGSSSTVSSGPALSTGVVVLFGAVVVAGVIAVVGMVAHSYGSYQKVSTATDSEVSEKVRLDGMKSRFEVKFEKLSMDSCDGVQI